MKLIGIIPARYASMRFPGKPLVNIGGRPMVQRVYEQAQKSNVFHDLAIATDDERIASAVRAFGGNAIMTSAIHPSGTDRCAEAAEKMGCDKQDVIINIQGDEPFIYPEQITTLASCFQGEQTKIATLIKKIENKEELFNPNTPKVIINKSQQVIYFSRHPIPYLRNIPQEQWLQRHKFYKHIGMYGYRVDTLKEITALEPSSLEKAESLEQLRWLENDYTIYAAITEKDSLSIDTPEDLAKTKDIYGGNFIF